MNDLPESFKKMEVKEPVPATVPSTKSAESGDKPTDGGAKKPVVDDERPPEIGNLKPDGPVPVT